MEEPSNKRVRLDSHSNDGHSDAEEVHKPFLVERISEKRIRKYNVEEITYRAKFNHEMEGRKLIDVTEDLQDMFQEILDNISTDHDDPNDRARLSIRHQGLDREIFIHCQPKHNITPEVIMERVGAVLQSNQGLNVDETFEVDVGIMRGLEAGGGSSRLITNTDLNSRDCSIRGKKSMVFIPAVEHEFLCAGRAIVTCMAKLQKMPSKEFRNMTCKTIYTVKSSNPKSQRMRAIKLYIAAGVPMSRAVPISELYKFENHLNVQIIVVSGDSGNDIVYKGEKMRKNKIYLYLKDDHYHSIVNIQGFFVNKKFCQQCLTVYGRGYKHSCAFKCSVCCQETCMTDDSSVNCPDCNMFCRNAKCFLSHKQSREYTIGSLRGSPRLSLCDTYHKCKKCSKIVDKTKRDVQSHKCGEWFCKCCGEYVLNEHLCYYRIKKPKKTSGRFIFYDFETSQDSVINCEKGYHCQPSQNCLECNSESMCTKCRKCVNCKRSYCGLNRHIPNYLVCQTACNHCKDSECFPQSVCSFCGDRCKDCGTLAKGCFIKQLCNNGTCGRRERVFNGEHTTRDFCQWLITPQHKGMIVMAHNSKAFDGHFILGYCVENGVFPDIIYQGSKIMTMTIGQGVDLRFIDSLNFLPMALKKLPKALNLAQDLKKGQFPHFINKKENWNLVTPKPPPPEMYGITYMSTRDRAEFMEWYDTVKDQKFDFQKEILSYTRSDVAILREACMKFRDLIMDVTKMEGSEGLDPFAHATIASSAMQVIRQLMLYEEHDVVLLDGRKGRGVLKRGSWTFEGQSIDEELIAETTFVKSPIPQIPSRGYGKHPNDSEKAAVWLEWVAHKSGRLICHSRNGGEYRVPGTRYHVDGYHQSSKTVYEFLGCRFHGHSCMKDREKIYDPRTNTTLHTVYQRTLLRLDAIRALGYDTVIMWECNFDRMMRVNTELREFARTVDTVKPLKIRDSFFGGRVSPIKLYYNVEEGEKVKYMDVTSLYPKINLSGRYPTCHAKIITNPNDIDYTLDSHYGLVKLKVLPPRELYIPVLPVRCGGKLKFPLCAKCSREETSKKCKCTDSNRALTGTWTTEEVKAAISAGYKIIKIYEVYHFEETSTDPGCPGSIFEEYVKMFLKVKQEASGYPEWVTTDADKNAYIANYAERQGIQLEKGKIVHNPSLRLISKLYANSAWGKFVQRPNMSQTVYVKSRTDLAKIRNDPTKTVTNFHVINDDFIVLEFCKADSYEEENVFTNEIIGTFTTSLARLHLLKILQKTDRDTLYFDTDSVIYREKDGHNTLVAGDLLGELTDELGSGRHIVTFLSSGPKSYCFKLNDGTCQTKIKGITLNHVNSQVIDFNVMKDVVTGRLQNVKLPHSTQINRVKHRGIVYNRPHSKIFRKVFNKRVLVEGSYDTLPYGY